MSSKVYINGELFDQADAKISVFDHGLLYGDGVFEGLRVYNGKVFKLMEHVDRLYDSAKAICLEIPMSRSDMADAVDSVVAANSQTDCYVRLVVTRGAGTLGLDPNRTSNPQVIIITAPIALYGPDLYEKGLEIVTVSTIRNHPAALNPRIKSLNYLNNILAKIEGLQSGCQEALMLNHNGEVSECSADNIFIVRDGVLKTPPIDAGILDGITRNAVLDLAKEAGIPCCEAAMTRYDIYVADECFLTGSAAELIAVVKVDNRVIGDGRPGPFTRELLTAFRKLVQS